MFQRATPIVALFSIAALSSFPCMAAVHGRHASASVHKVSSHVSSHMRSRHPERSEHAERAAAVHHEAAPAMEAERATAIQTALIRAGYLTGEPSGVWDADSVAAMQKLQDANGWQTKYTPDSRALGKLGLGAVQPIQPVAAVTESAQGAAAQP